MAYSAHVGKRKLTDEQRAAKAATLRIRGERLAELRARAGYETKADVVRAGHLDSGTLSNIETGKSDMFVETALELVHAYGVPLDVLVGIAPVPPIDEPYPLRAPIVASPEFHSAPENVRQWFATLRPDGGEQWSTVAWARAFERGLGLALSGVHLPTHSSGIAPIQLVKPPSQPPPSRPRLPSPTPKPPSAH